MTERKTAENTAQKTIGRRAFLGGAAAAAALTAGCGILRMKPVPPSEKLNVAFIGSGGKGMDNLNKLSAKPEVNIVGLCDVDANHLAKAAEKHPAAKTYSDFRIMLEQQQDIDAVVVTTPDHMHAFAAMMAIKLGKHVYCEKPLTHSVWEARQLAAAAREAGVATQMGNSGQAAEQTRQNQEWLEDGAIGTVREVHLWTDRPVWPQGIGRPTETPAVPDHLNWDVWLGPAPERPYHPAYHPFAWRGWRDFGAGAIGDMACHYSHPVFRALNLGHPTSVVAESSRVMHEHWKVWENNETYPRASIIRYRFPARGDRPAIEFTWHDGGLLPWRPDELEDDRKLGTNGTMYVGDKGILLDGRLIPETKMKEYERPPKTLPRSPGHYQEWINACKGGPPAGSNFDEAGLVTEVVLLGNVAIKTGKRLEWDGEKLEVTNVPEANQHLKREYRKGWDLA